MTLGGLPGIVKPSLISLEPGVMARALILLGSAAQSNPSVQAAVLEAQIIPLITNVFCRPGSESILQSRAIYAISSLGGWYAYFKLGDH